MQPHPACNRPYASCAWFQAIALFALFAFCAPLASAVEQCGNNNPCGPDAPPPDDCGNCPGEGDGGNKFNVHNGNVFREINDLISTGGVGHDRLVWSRYAFSRWSESKRYFGESHNWRHSYQWELTEQTDSAGGVYPVLLVYGPKGGKLRFTSLNGQTWLVGGPMGDRIEKSGSVYTLHKGDGSEVDLALVGTVFRATALRDTSGLATTLTYNAAAELTRVTEPAGRTLDLTYGNLDGYGPKWDRIVATITTPPVAGAWNEIAVTGTALDGWSRTYRFFGAPGTHCELGELQFIDKSTSQPITGTALAPTLAFSATQGATAAFDGQTGTTYKHWNRSLGWVGLDAGTGKQVKTIRFFVPAGANPDSYVGSVFSGNGNITAKLDSGIRVMARVTAFDSRFVRYEYDGYTNPTTGVPSINHTGAVYSDDSRATYTYAQLASNRTPQMVEAHDVRDSTLLRRVRYEYAAVDSPYGIIFRETDPVTGGVIAERIAPTSSNLYSVYRSSGGQAVYQMYSTGGGNVNRYTDTLGRVTNYTYANDAAGKPTGRRLTETDPLGRVTRYESYSARGGLLRLVHPDGTVETWTRDSRDLPLTHTLSHPADAQFTPRTTTWTRDAARRVTRVDHPDATYETFSYNPYGQVLSHRRRDGSSISNAYDARGLRLSSTDPLGRQTTYAYDSSDRLASITDPLLRVTHYAYNDRDLLTDVTFPDGAMRLSEYDAYGKLILSIDELGHETTYTYDHFGRLLTQTAPLGRVTTLSYALPAGGPGGCGCASVKDKPTLIISPSGQRTRIGYDSEWQILSRIEAADTLEAATTTYTYFADGTVSKVTDPLGHEIRYTYDSRKRRLTQTDADSRVASWTYDRAGNVLTTTQPGALTTTYTYDAADRVLSARDPKGDTVRYAYDGLGRLLTLRDERDKLTSFSYDAAGRQLRRTWHDGTYRESTYDLAGQPLTLRVESGVIARYRHDLLGRQIAVDWSDTTPDRLSAFDDRGLLVSLQTGSFAPGGIDAPVPALASTQTTLAYTYDAAAALLGETTSLPALGYSATVAYSYDAAGRRQSLTYPDGHTVSYAYTVRDQLREITAGSPPPLVTYGYDLDGRRTSKVFETGLRADYTYTAANLLSGLSYGVGSPGTLGAIAYTRDTAARIAGWTRTGAVFGTGELRAFDYDPASQVTGVRDPAQPQPLETFAYDPAGNRTAATQAGFSTAYTTNDLNQYTAISAAAPTYDIAGNLLTGLGSFVYGYDSQNRLVSAESGNERATILYDGRNRAVLRTRHTRTDLISPWLPVEQEVQSYDGWSLISESRGTGSGLTQTARYVHGANLDEILVVERASQPTPLYYLHDHLGSTVALVDASSALVERYAYTTFGQATAYAPNGQALTASAVGNRFLYTGREWRSELQLADHRNRYYAPTVGRWLSRDPIEQIKGERPELLPEGPNLYAYVGNNVINLYDPDGLAVPVIPIIIGGTVAATLAYCAYINSNDCADQCGEGKVKSATQEFFEIDALFLKLRVPCGWSCECCP